MNQLNLDKVLISIGPWGKFQTLVYFSLCTVIICSVFPLGYIFTARDIKYRCKIKGCDKKNSTDYSPAWLQNAVPFTNDEPSRCSRYLSLNNATCDSFNRTQVVKCYDFIYERNEITIVQDFDVFCDENLWKLTIVGTLSGLGQVACLPIAGFLSDRFGRKPVIIGSVFSSAVIGLIRSFSVDYYMYLALTFLDTALTAGMYSAAFILGMELLDSKTRDLGNTFLCLSYSFGQVLLGLVAWASSTWRIQLRALYSNGFVVCLFLLFIPESVRWLISKERHSEALVILQRIAKCNKAKQVVDTQLVFLEEESSPPPKEKIKPPKEKMNQFIALLKNRTMLMRTAHCAFTWICCSFPYEGLSIESVALSKNLHLNFILTAFIEMPAYLFTYGCISFLGKKKTMAYSLLLSGLFCFCVNFVRNEAVWVLVVFLVSKFYITVAYTTLFVFTAEIFPTSARHQTFAVCSMFGRLGTMMAPQVPLLARIFRPLPMILFSAMSVIAGVLAFWFPETHNTNLPDEIDEAVHIEEKQQK